MENAGTQIAPLVTLFGPVRRVTALATHRADAQAAPDLSFGLLEFDDGVVARLTTATTGPVNRSLRLVGTEGSASLADVWDFPAQASLSPAGCSGARGLLRKVEGLVQGWAPGIGLGPRLISAKPSTMVRLKGGGPRFDFARGISALVDAVRGGPNRVPASLGLHILEVSWALQAAPGSATQTITTQPERPALYDWAK
ncbi:Gfo/Idh/MocA family protein [Pararhodospirillum photometricum]|uniref:Oxidoreductase, Gfo/Idh/MocA family protein n=1 Tax=Pararhodospirillum photometricum DSM 122 TaxID=1150469 RepID=H6SMA2_PARPM|nr:hypothetical protein [Pararhodospirillum photometricum]CCG06785.1 Oxidoreductase, Gfo/Idh/MocA family protein [Pararhodospirillum photometricum DSM 122]